MLNIRRNTFETNSSSVHSITMCMKSDYDAWCNGDMWLYDRSTLPEGKTSPFFTWDELIEFLKSYEYGPSDDNLVEIIKMKDDSSDELDDVLSEYDFFSCDMYDKCNEEYEHYYKEFTTPDGETVISFGYHGDNY